MFPARDEVDAHRSTLAGGETQGCTCQDGPVDRRPTPWILAGLALLLAMAAAALTRLVLADGPGLGPTNRTTAGPMTWSTRRQPPPGPSGDRER